MTQVPDAVGGRQHLRRSYAPSSYSARSRSGRPRHRFVRPTRPSVEVDIWDMRQRTALMSIVFVTGLVGCGSPTAGTSGRGTSSGDCTIIWNGQAGDYEYTDPGNWSAGRVPAPGDFGCIPPGSFVEVDRPPVERASTLLIEGTVCMRGDAFQLADSTINGTQPGEPTLPPLPRAITSAADCPTGTDLSSQGSEGGLRPTPPWAPPEPPGGTSPGLRPTSPGAPVTPTVPDNSGPAA